jgi:hypothetical protein
MKPYLEKKKSQKRAGVVAQAVGPEFKPQHCKKIKYINKSNSENSTTKAVIQFRKWVKDLDNFFRHFS